MLMAGGGTGVAFWSARRLLALVCSDVYSKVNSLQTFVNNLGLINISVTSPSSSHMGTKGRIKQPLDDFNLIAY